MSTVETNLTFSCKVFKLKIVPINRHQFDIARSIAGKKRIMKKKAISYFNLDQLLEHEQSSYFIFWSEIEEKTNLWLSRPVCTNCIRWHVRIARLRELQVQASVHLSDERSQIADANVTLYLTAVHRIATARHWITSNMHWLAIAFN